MLHQAGGTVLEKVTVSTLLECSKTLSTNSSRTVARVRPLAASSQLQLLTLTSPKSIPDMTGYGPLITTGGDLSQISIIIIIIKGKFPLF